MSVLRHGRIALVLNGMRTALSLLQRIESTERLGLDLQLDLSVQPSKREWLKWLRNYEIITIVLTTTGDIEQEAVDVRFVLTICLSSFWWVP